VKTTEKEAFSTIPWARHPTSYSERKG